LHPEELVDDHQALLRRVDRLLALAAARTQADAAPLPQAVE